MRVLFICKKNECYGFVSYTRRSSGLFNSTRFIAEALSARGDVAKVVEVVDNNSIDREISLFKPDVVVIEALWVVPEKFPVLRRLHPGVRWLVHLHSHMPFLALEGIAIDWITQYAEQGILLIANSRPSYEALRCLLYADEVFYLENVYISDPREPVTEDCDKDVLDVACFGAMRPMKNHLLQALASIRFAKEIRKDLKFHVNASRIETGGAPVLKNLRKLFAYEINAELVEHDWHEPEDFIELLREMDIGLQVSMTETFNVVCADYVTAGIPIVGSKEISWISRFTKARDDSALDIVRVMRRSWQSRSLVRWNQRLLVKHSGRAQRAWFEFLHRLTAP